MIVPSTMACATSGCMPNACNAQPVPFRLSCTAFTVEEPISRPMQGLAMDPLRFKILARHAEISKNARMELAARPRFDKEAGQRRARCADRSGNPVLLHLGEQRAVADLEQACGMGAISVGDAQGLADELRLQEPDRLLERQGRVCRIALRRAIAAVFESQAGKGALG